MGTAAQGPSLDSRLRGNDEGKGGNDEGKGGNDEGKGGNGEGKGGAVSNEMPAVFKGRIYSLLGSKPVAWYTSWMMSLPMRLSICLCTGTRAFFRALRSSAVGV